jgi:hypothetical protein
VDPTQPDLTQIVELTSELLWIALLANAIGVVACFIIAKMNRSRYVAFWTTMSLLFGPFAIPFALWRTWREKKLSDESQN